MAASIEPIPGWNNAAMPEISIVMPVLNEADTLAICIAKAQQALQGCGAAGEILIADNGSTDGSIEIAESLGARVVPVAEKGYGSALMGGIEAARAPWVLMGDADDSYDFLEIPKFLKQLRAGHELVQGCRLPWGGGTVLAGAMPVLHRWWGNPMFTILARRMFGAPINDIYCGMRAFTKDLYTRLDQRCIGMEFATEMIIKASLFNARIAEVPITLHPDGRKAHAPHLKTFRDGWRTLRFFLMLSPMWLYRIPGGVLLLLAIIGTTLALPGASIGQATFGVHTLLVSGLCLLLAHLSVSFGQLARQFSINEGLLPASVTAKWYHDTFTLERMLVLSFLLLLTGAGVIGYLIIQWAEMGYGRLDYAETMRLLIPATTLCALGMQNLMISFFLSILDLKRRTRA